MQTTTANPTPGSTCPDGSPTLGAPPTRGAAPVATIFPPRDADDDTYRRWLATSPWPEVVFASAGAR